MPIRTASLNKKISANGQKLHRATVSRMKAGQADKEPSKAEAAILEERQQLKEERAKRKEQGPQPRASALERLVRTRRAVAKDKPKVKNETSDAAKETKKPKARGTRADKAAEKAAALEAARRTPKKPAK
jgi:hypothetical protein